MNPWVIYYLECIQSYGGFIAQIVVIWWVAVFMFPHMQKVSNSLVNGMPELEKSPSEIYAMSSSWRR